jgi:hypothetical protein
MAVTFCPGSKIEITSFDPKKNLKRDILTLSHTINVKSLLSSWFNPW